MKRLLIVALCGALGCTSLPNESVVNAPTADHSFVLDSLLDYDSEQELINRFGKENIGRDTAWYPEGMGQYMVTVLYPGTKNEVALSWLDSASYMGLDEIRVSADSSEWISKGVMIGTPLSDLVRLNGSHFSFSGFDWDYGGYTNWGEDGKLRGLTVRLRSSEAMMAQEQLDSLIGDRTVLSRSTAARLNNPVVSEMRLLKERE
jgi:hypothetical protein